LRLVQGRGQFDIKVDVASIALPALVALRQPQDDVAIALARSPHRSEPIDRR
jgi:hypothetical protein